MLNTCFARVRMRGSGCFQGDSAGMTHWCPGVLLVLMVPHAKQCTQTDGAEYDKARQMTEIKLAMSAI